MSERLYFFLEKHKKSNKTIHNNYLKNMFSHYLKNTCVILFLNILVLIYLLNLNLKKCHCPSILPEVESRDEFGTLMEFLKGK